jgi:Protein of unknown function (DUF3761)
MTEGQRLMLLIGVIVLVLIWITRWSSLLGGMVRRPMARCRDGSLSFSTRRCGTCSHHGGVAEFLPV